MANRLKKYYAIFVLILIVVILSIGYSYLNSSLAINGTSNINNPTWSIYFDDVVVDDESFIYSSENATPTIGSDLLSLSYDVVFDTPGQFYDFTVNIINDGSIDAMIGSITSTINNQPITSLPSYLTYSVTYYDGVEIGENQLLAAGSWDVIKIRIEYLKDIEVSDLPTTEVTLHLDYSMEYVQKGVDAFVRPNYIYTTSSSIFHVGSIPPAGVFYTDYHSAVNISEKPFFIRHLIVDDLVSESYIGFIYKGHIYYVRGGSATPADTYEKNKAVLYEAFGNDNCFENTEHFMCRTSNLSIETSEDNWIKIVDIYASDSGINNEGSWLCSISVLDNSASNCVIRSN